MDKGKRGIKVKELAHELGLTSRQLMDRCRAEGIFVQNSITKLDRSTETKVRKWYSLNQSGTSPAKTNPDE